MKLLDLFCGAGGAAMGYHRAGFNEIVGIDNRPQPRYPFRFIRADALKPPVRLEDFDVIHASPPCQGYTPMTNRRPSHQLRLIPEVRTMLRGSGRPYVIENVVGAPLEAVRICGKALGLVTRRHRLFESNVPLWGLPHGAHEDSDVSVYGPADGRRIWTRVDGSELRAWRSISEGQTALGIDWTAREIDLREAIPPAYTEFIGRQLLESLERVSDEAKSGGRATNGDYREEDP